MSLGQPGVQAIIDAVRSHAMRTGHFGQETGHDPGNAPGRDLSTAVVVQTLAPYAGGSGLASTSMRLVLSVRVYLPTSTRRPDDIDPRLVGAVDRLMEAYTGDFGLGGRVRNVDVFGAAGGAGLEATFGYVEFDGAARSKGALYRFGEITLPLICNDLYEQTP